MLEIYRYVPAELISRPVMEMDIDEYLEFLAKARYLEEVERDLYMEALAGFFGDT